MRQVEEVNAGRFNHRGHGPQGRVALGEKGSGHSVCTNSLARLSSAPSVGSDSNTNGRYAKDKRPLTYRFAAETLNTGHLPDWVLVAYDAPANRR